MTSEEPTGDDTTVAVITIGDETTAIEIAGITEYEIPRGMVSLHRTHITADPPLPQNLTNAIGDMMDHFDDAVRQVPLLTTAAAVIVAGAAAEAIAAVEVGGEIGGDTFELSRSAAEDVFRTLASEPSDQRSRNPGLPAELVEAIPAGCCALVALLRSLQLRRITVQMHRRTDQTGIAGATTAAPG